MSIARHHAEWLSLLEISGPFLSMPVLTAVFPQGLDVHDREQAQLLRAAYEEWADNQGGLAPEVAIHRAWLRFVLTQTLAWPDELLAEGQAIPESIKATLAEHGETIRPDMMLVEPDSGRPCLLLHTYPATQDLHKVVPGRNWKASPAMRLLELLHSTGVRLGLATNGEEWLLVQASRGETTGYVSWYAGLWLEEPLTLRAFHSLLGASRFFGVPEEQTLPALLDASAKEQQEVTDQLGYQVRRAVEILVQAIDRADQDRGRTLLVGVSEAQLYEAALTVMMRLVFLLTAEERGLLLLGDPLYDQNYAVSTLRAQLRAQADQHGEEVVERGFDAWCRLLATCRAVHGGVYHENLNLPAYGGSLFDPDRFPFLEGRMPVNSEQLAVSSEHTDPLPINNRTTLHLLEALQILRVQVPGGGGSRSGSATEARRLSFRALDIEQIGHVYEGLLDHEARRATEPVLGLAGTKHKEPEVALAHLEKLAVSDGRGVREQWAVSSKQGEVSGERRELDESSLEKLLDFLQEETGRSRAALKKELLSSEQWIVNSEQPYPPLTAHRSLPTDRLRIACGNDENLYRRVLPFAGLIRDDDYGWPVVVPAGSVYVTAGATRRATGTHYTPRSLTEPIVQHTLEPLVYVGPAEGRPREQWRLRSPKELLELKVCDMAMGSGAFLVQACRYLSERLVEAWAAVSSEQLAVNSEQSHSLSTAHRSPFTAHLQITPEGEPASGDPGETIIPDNDEERLALARRLVADRCLYGVDKNPLAVEMAKLSLWLVTLSKNKPFTFVNHALRHGDSLIGAEEDGYNRWWHSLKGTVGPLYGEETEKALHEARRLRRELQEMQVLDVQDAQRKAALLAEAERATARMQRACDLLVGIQLLGLSQTEQEGWRQKLLIEHVGSEEMNSPEAKQALAAAKQHDAFHWFMEFPEVFAQGGFSAFMGNPPFIGGQRIRATMGGDYLQYLKERWNHAKGSADYSAYFFLTAFANLRVKGNFGLIATNTIAQGATLELGLDHIHKQGGSVYHAYNDYPWPGQAAVVVDIVHIHKGKHGGQKIVDGITVSNITPMLDVMSVYDKPYQLQANAGKSFQGSNVLGLGFTMPLEEAQEHIARNLRNKDVLFPYLNGQDLNSSPTQMPSRWVINFFDWPLERSANGSWHSADEKQQKQWLQKGRVPRDYPDPVAADYPEMLKIVKEKVYPERVKNRDKQRREIWWRFTRPTIDLYQTVQPLELVLVLTIVSKTVAFCFVPNKQVYAHRLAVFPFDQHQHFTLLQSSFHYHWAWQHSSTLKQDLNYAPRDVFETFPFPKTISCLQNIGEAYHKHRRQLMLDRQEGLTATYNRFHDPSETAQDIAHLRHLHVEMDNAVAAAYGWSDLVLGHGFHETAQGIRYTISEPARHEVLTRLLQLNHQRYEEEVAAGLHEKGRKAAPKSVATKGKKPSKKNDGQLSMF